MSIARIRRELETNAADYEGLSDAQILARLNTVATVSITVETISKQALWDAIHLPDLNALSPLEVLSKNEQRFWHWVAALGDTVRTSGNNVTFLTSIFGGGSQTIANLAAARNKTVTFAEYLGVDAIPEGWIARAKGGA